MPQFVALLRGVNVGKGNRVPMAAFRALLEAQGFTEVRTLLNSGNAVFRSNSPSPASHAQAIGTRLQAHLGLKVVVVVKSSAEFLAAVAQGPLVGESEHSRLLVGFAQDEATTRALSNLRNLLLPHETLHVGHHAAYLHCADGILESRAGSALLGRLGGEVTTRNWSTVQKLKALLQ